MKYFAIMERSDKLTLPLPFMSALGFHFASPRYVLKAFASRDKSARAHLARAPTQDACISRNHDFSEENDHKTIYLFKQQTIKLNVLRILERGQHEMVNVHARSIGNVWFGVVFERECIQAANFGSSEKNVLRGLRQSIPSDTTFEPLENEFADRVITVLKNVYDGKEVSRSLSLDMERLSNYARRIIGAVCLIPLGYVASYGGVARAAGGSPRAVGHVMALNPFAPLCPCHRVVTSDFTLGGYGGGLDVKLEFLKREQRGYSSKKVIEVDGGKLELFPVEFVLNRLNEGKC